MLPGNTALKELHLFGNNIAQGSDMMKALEGKLSSLKIMK
jgi:hypothetical protein